MKVMYLDNILYKDSYDRYFVFVSNKDGYYNIILYDVVEKEYYEYESNIIVDNYQITVNNDKLFLFNVTSDKFYIIVYYFRNNIMKEYLYDNNYGVDINNANIDAFYYNIDELTIYILFHNESRYELFKIIDDDNNFNIYYVDGFLFKDFRDDIKIYNTYIYSVVDNNPEQLIKYNYIDGTYDVLIDVQVTAYKFDNKTFFCVDYKNDMYLYNIDIGLQNITSFHFEESDIYLVFDNKIYSFVLNDNNIYCFENNCFELCQSQIYDKDHDYPDNIHIISDYEYYWEEDFKIYYNKINESEFFDDNILYRFRGINGLLNIYKDIDDKLFFIKVNSISSDIYFYIYDIKFGILEKIFIDNYLINYFDDKYYYYASDKLIIYDYVNDILYKTYDLNFYCNGFVFKKSDNKYLFFGCNVNANEVWEYDIETNTSKCIGILNYSLRSSIIVYYNDKYLYVRDYDNINTIYCIDLDNLMIINSLYINGSLYEFNNNIIIINGNSIKYYDYELNFIKEEVLYSDIYKYNDIYYDYEYSIVNNFITIFYNNKFYYLGYNGLINVQNYNNDDFNNLFFPYNWYIIKNNMPILYYRSKPIYHPEIYCNYLFTFDNNYNLRKLKDLEFNIIDKYPNLSYSVNEFIDVFNYDKDNIAIYKNDYLYLYNVTTNSWSFLINNEDVSYFNIFKYNNKYYACCYGNTSKQIFIDVYENGGRVYRLVTDFIYNNDEYFVFIYNDNIYLLNNEKCFDVDGNLIFENLCNNTIRYIGLGYLICGKKLLHIENGYIMDFINNINFMSNVLTVDYDLIYIYDYPNVYKISNSGVELIFSLYTTSDSLPFMYNDICHKIDNQLNFINYLTGEVYTFEYNNGNDLLVTYKTPSNDSRYQRQHNYYNNKIYQYGILRSYNDNDGTRWFSAIVEFDLDSKEFVIHDVNDQINYIEFNSGYYKSYVIDNYLYITYDTNYYYMNKIYRVNLDTFEIDYEEKDYINYNNVFNINGISVLINNSDSDNYIVEQDGTRRIISKPNYNLDLTYRGGYIDGNNIYMIAYENNGFYIIKYNVQDDVWYKYQFIDFDVQIDYGFYYNNYYYFFANNKFYKIDLNNGLYYYINDFNYDETYYNTLGQVVFINNNWYFVTYSTYYSRVKIYKIDTNINVNYYGSVSSSYLWLNDGFIAIDNNYIILHKNNDLFLRINVISIGIEEFNAGSVADESVCLSNCNFITGVYNNIVYYINLSQEEDNTKYLFTKYNNFELNLIYDYEYKVYIGCYKKYLVVNKNTQDIYFINGHYFLDGYIYYGGLKYDLDGNLLSQSNFFQSSSSSILLDYFNNDIILYKLYNYYLYNNIIFGESDTVMKYNNYYINTSDNDYFYNYNKYTYNIYNIKTLYNFNQIYYNDDIIYDDSLSGDNEYNFDTVKPISKLLFEYGDNIYYIKYFDDSDKIELYKNNYLYDIIYFNYKFYDNSTNIPMFELDKDNGILYLYGVDFIQYNLRDKTKNIIGIIDNYKQSLLLNNKSIYQLISLGQVDGIKYYCFKTNDNIITLTFYQDKFKEFDSALLIDNEIIYNLKYDSVNMIVNGCRVDTVRKYNYKFEKNISNYHILKQFPYSDFYDGNLDGYFYSPQLNLIIGGKDHYGNVNGILKINNTYYLDGEKYINMKKYNYLKYQNVVGCDTNYDFIVVANYYENDTSVYKVEYNDDILYNLILTLPYKLKDFSLTFFTHNAQYNYIAVVGGMQYVNNYVNFNKILLINYDTKNIDRIIEMPKHLNNPIVFYSDNKLFICGGYYNNEVNNDIFIYDIDNDIIEQYIDNNGDPIITNFDNNVLFEKQQKNDNIVYLSVTNALYNKIYYFDINTLQYYVVDNNNVINTLPQCYVNYNNKILLTPNNEFFGNSNYFDYSHICVIDNKVFFSDLKLKYIYENTYNKICYYNIETESNEYIETNLINNNYYIYPKSLYVINNALIVGVVYDYEKVYSSGNYCSNFVNYIFVYSFKDNNYFNLNKNDFILQKSKIHNKLSYDKEDSFVLFDFNYDTLFISLYGNEYRCTYYYNMHMQYELSIYDNFELSLYEHAYGGMGYAYILDHFCINYYNLYQEFLSFYNWIDNINGNIKSNLLPFGRYYTYKFNDKIYFRYLNRYVDKNYIINNYYNNIISNDLHINFGYFIPNINIIVPYDTNLNYNTINYIIDVNNNKTIFNYHIENNKEYNIITYNNVNNNIIIFKFNQEIPEFGYLYQNGQYKFKGYLPVTINDKIQFVHNHDNYVYFADKYYLYKFNFDNFMINKIFKINFIYDLLLGYKNGCIYYIIHDNNIANIYKYNILDNTDIFIKNLGYSKYDNKILYQHNKDYILYEVNSEFYYLDNNDNDVNFINGNNLNACIYNNLIYIIKFKNKYIEIETINI